MLYDNVVLMSENMPATHSVHYYIEGSCLKFTHYDPHPYILKVFVSNQTTFTVSCFADPEKECHHGKVKDGNRDVKACQ